jgi:hypothetical protein
MRRSLTIIAFALLSGCGGHVSDDIQTKYTSRVRQLGLTPVYPPREEIQVGDLFLNSEHPGSDEHAVRQYITTIPSVLDLAQANLDDRVVFASSVPVNSGAPTDDTVSQQDDLVNGRITTRRGLRRAPANSLPLAVFPEVTAYAGGDLSAGILAPLQALGLFAGSRTTVTLNFKDVRTYFAPPMQAFAVGRAEVCRRLPGPSQISGEAAYVKNAATAVDAAKYGPLANAASALRSRHLFYRLVTRVYLTRSITYTYRNARLLSIARKNLANPSAGAGAATFPASIVNVTVSPAPASGTSAGTTADVTSAINDLKAQTASISEGERFVGFSALGLTIERVFKQPVAVAFEGIDYEPDWTALDCGQTTGAITLAKAGRPASTPTVADSLSR